MSWSFMATKSKTDAVNWIMSEEVSGPTYVKDFICAALAHLTTDEAAMVIVESSGHLATAEQYGASWIHETNIELAKPVTEAKVEPPTAHTPPEEPQS